MSVDLLPSVEFYRGADPPPCQVRTAFDVLSDPAKRKVSRLPPYDRMSSYAKLIPAPHTPLPIPRSLHPASLGRLMITVSTSCAAG